MSWPERYQTLLILSAILVGLTLGQVPWLSERANALIVPSLMVMLGGIFLHVPLDDLTKAFRNLRFAGASLGINFLWNPVLAWGLGAVFLADTPELWVGLIMLMVTPCTDWYLVFTALARGNVALGMTLLPWNLLLQLALLPVYLLVFAGAIVDIQPFILVENVALVLVVPLAFALLVRRAAAALGRSGWLKEMVLPRASAAQPLFLSLAIAAMFASQGEALPRQPELVARLALPVLLFFAINFGLTQAVGRAMRFRSDEMAAFTCTALARNSPVALAIAVTAFPDRPLVALVLVIGPLIELPVLALVARALIWLRPGDASQPS